MMPDLLAEQEKAARRYRAMMMQLRRARKAALIARCSLQAKHHKASLIIAPKGKNGRSMSDALLAAHGITKPAKEVES